MKREQSKPLSLTADEWRRLVVDGIVSVKHNEDYFKPGKSRVIGMPLINR